MAIITISRGSFAGGKALATRLSERLSYASLSREQVLHEAAESFGIAEPELVDSLNKSPRYWVQNPGKRLAYVKCVTAVLLRHAGQGSLVYHGHVGHLLLSELPQVVRVRVVADIEYRVQAAMQYANLSHDQALARIRRVDH
ncbi:MAG: cytidylate kinase-like family protein, partial [Planctomycetes bacterium]|nr:cytidylate kinase-like family protein [Planctomycetota bacterium]